MNEKLKPCPFCGKGPDLSFLFIDFTSTETTEEKANYFEVACHADECRINPVSGSHLNKQDAIYYWNYRGE